MQKKSILLIIFILSLFVGIVPQKTDALNRTSLIQDIRSGAGISGGTTNAYNIVTVVINTQGSYLSGGSSTHPATATQTIQEQLAKIQEMKNRLKNLH